MAYGLGDAVVLARRLLDGQLDPHEITGLLSKLEELFDEPRMLSFL